LCAKTTLRHHQRRANSSSAWKAASGEVFNAVRLLANNPQQASALINFVRSVRHNNQLTPTLTELAYATASVVNACHY
jgi:alkylhydroperoxidase family enzyme